MTDKSRGYASTLVLGQYSHLVKPTADTIVSGDSGADHCFFFHCNQQHAVLQDELGVEYL